MTRQSILPAAFGAIALAALLSAVGTFGLVGEGSETHATREYLVVLGIIGVAALAVFGWAVPRALDSPVVGWTAVVLGVLAIVSVLAFWSGLPPVLAAGAVILGWAQRATTRGRIAVALGAFALAADVIVWIGDATSWF
jgi:phosphoglycerol transferase MdoB-like AlkP superfamily enzyme